MDRKQFFSVAYKRLLKNCVDLVSDNKVLKALENLGVQKQRPPGAASEKEFQNLCTGCDACMIACPVNVIMIDDLQRRLPLIYPEEAPCIHCDGYPCIKACPTGALDLSNGTHLRNL